MIQQYEQNCLYRLNISQSCYYQQHREIPRERRGLWKCITANIL
jgi:hypothetical protein